MRVQRGPSPDASERNVRYIRCRRPWNNLLSTQPAPPSRAEDVLLVLDVLHYVEGVRGSRNVVFWTLRELRMGVENGTESGASPAHRILQRERKIE